MHTLEFILVFTLLLGIVAGLTDPISMHVKMIHEIVENWERETEGWKCEWDEQRSNAQFVLMSNSDCPNVGKWFGWDANHYE